jgi:hypothetical protein
MRVRVLVIGMCIAVIAACSEREVSGLLRSMADGGPLPTENQFYGTVDEDYISRLSEDEVKDFLPLAQKLLSDPRPDARKYGLAVFLAVTVRRFSDSELLLEPYVPDLLKIADDRGNALRPMALHILGNTWPKRPPLTVAYLKLHIRDKQNTPRDIGWMACTLLLEGSDDLTRDVFEFVRQQNNPETLQNVLGCFHVLPATKNADALSFISTSLDNADVWVRRKAIEAIERLPLVERSPFLAQLNRLANDAKQPLEIRSQAKELLKK